MARIISGSLRLKNYILKNPSLEDIYIANEIYEEAAEEGFLNDAMSEAEIIKFLYDQGIWDNEKEELLKRIPKDIEDFKVKLFQSNFKSNEKKSIKELIQKAKLKLYNLFSIKCSYNHLGYIYQANLLKNRYLIFSSLYYKGKRVFQDDIDIFWDIADSQLIDDIIAEKNEMAISDTIYRELARTEPWRSYWSLKKDSLFGIPVVSYTEEQKTLCSWSSLYDSIHEHPKCPSDEVMQDDDMLDGWMIIQRRERDKNLGNHDFISNEKIRNSQEIYIPADTKEDAKKVDNLNDTNSKRVKENRFAFLAKVGEVKHADMPDVKRDIGMKLNRMELNERK